MRWWWRRRRTPTSMPDINASTVPVAVVRNERAHGDTGAEGEKRRHGIRRRRGIHNGRVVLRHVDHLRVGRLNLHHRVRHINNLLLNGLLHHGAVDDDLLLRIVLQRADRLRLGAQRLDGREVAERVLVFE